MVGATLIHAPFVNHENGAIFAIDCHPTEEKFITCGQKGNSRDGLVVVWNIAPIIDSTKCKENVPKMLFQVQSQTTANTCRWSPDGRRFAFGSDDSSVSVWEYVGRVNSIGSLTGGANVERYKEICVLRGHSMEVLAVEWSQNGLYLASSSMDHRIIVYNAKKLPDRITVLTGSSSAVKGLSWDPIGKYLASLEGDKKLKLWATDSWQCVTTIDEPFEDSKEETMFSRLDWSPDGKYLLTPAAVKNGQPLIKLVQRQTWRSDHHLAGHQKGTTCVRCVPRIINTELRNGKKLSLTCAAVGSRDKSVSIWLFPGTVKPMLVIDSLFHHSVMDFAWCGRHLLVCSQDGSVKVVTLDEQLMGKALSNDEMSDLCYQTYSIRPAQYRRAPEEDSAPVESTSSQNVSFLTCPEEVLRERKKLEDKVPAKTKMTVIDDRPKQNNEQRASEKSMQAERSKQTETLKDGKRRIQPIFMASTALDSSEPIASSTVVKKPTTSAASPPPKRRVALAPDEVDLETSSDDSGDDEDEEEEESSDEEQPQTSKKKTSNPLLAMDFRKPVLRPIEPKSLKTTDGTVLMEAPEQQSTMSYLVPDRKGLLVEVDNRWRHGGVESTQVKLVKKRNNEVDGDEERRVVTETLWIVVIAAPVLVVAANRHFVLLGCGDKSLRVYRVACGSLLISLRLDSLPVLIGVKDHASYALTENGRLSTWNLKTQKAVITRQALFDCVEGAADNSLMSVDISESGVPLIVFSNGSVYTYSIGLACWIQAITTNVLARLTSPISAAQMEGGPLTRLLSRMRRQTTALGVPPQVSRAVKENQLEQLVQCAEQLGNSHDYQAMLNLYVEALCESGSEKKLKNVLNELSRSGAPLQVCGLRRAALYDDVTRMVKSRQPSIAERIVTGTTTNVKSSSKALF